jgi:hypothetical protein
MLIFVKKCDIIHILITVEVIRTFGTDGGGALENLLNECRRCKAEYFLPNLSGKRTEKRNFA